MGSLELVSILFSMRAGNSWRLITTGCVSFESLKVQFTFDDSLFNNVKKIGLFVATSFSFKSVDSGTKLRMQPRIASMILLFPCPFLPTNTNSGTVGETDKLYKLEFKYFDPYSFAINNKFANALYSRAETL
jgi:hypothetical protein